MNLKLSGVCELLRNTEGRDKCCKFIQYQSRMFMYLFTEPSPLVSDRFRKLFSKSPQRPKNRFKAVDRSPLCSIRSSYLSKVLKFMIFVLEQILPFLSF